MKDLPHWIDDCKNSTDNQKRKMKAALAVAKARDSSSKSTRAQKSRDGCSSSASSSSHPPSTRGTTGRLKQESVQDVYSDAPSCPMTVSEGTQSFDLTGCCDDGSDKSIFSPHLADLASV